MLLRVKCNELIGTVRRSVAHNDPLSRKDRLRENCFDRALDAGFFVFGRRYQYIAFLLHKSSSHTKPALVIGWPPRASGSLSAESCRRTVTGIQFLLGSLAALLFVPD